MEESVVLQRRRYPRRPFQRPVGYLQLGTYDIVLPETIGEGGLSLLVNTKKNFGDLVLVNFTLPGCGFFCIKSEIRYCVEKEGKFLVGMMFLDSEFLFKKNIRQFVSSTLE